MQLTVDDWQVSMLFVCSEDHRRWKRIPRRRRIPTVRQIQNTETLHAQLFCEPNVFCRWLQSAATQMLPTFQPHSVQQSTFTSTIRSLRQSSMLYVICSHYSAIMLPFQPAFVAHLSIQAPSFSQAPTFVATYESVHQRSLKLSHKLVRNATINNGIYSLQ